MKYCKEIRELLSLYIDNMLEDELKNKVETHIAFCPECKKEYEDMLKISLILQDMPEVPLPDDFDQRIHEAITASKEAESTAVIPLKKPDKMKKVFKYVSTAAAIFVVGIFSIAMYNNSEQLIPQDYACAYFPGNQAMDDAACDSEPSMTDSDMNTKESADSDGAVPQETYDNFYNVIEDSRAAESAEDVILPELNEGITNEPAEKKFEDFLPSRGGEFNILPEDRFILDYRITGGAIANARDTVALRYYMGSLERELGDKEFSILSCNKCDDGIWTFEVEIVSTDENDNELKEIVTYKAQDGTLWIED